MTSDTPAIVEPSLSSFENLTEAERVALDPEKAAAQAAAAAADKGTTDAAAAKVAGDAVAANSAAVADAAAAAIADAAARVVAGPTLLEVPEPPKDFEAEFDKLSAERKAYQAALKQYNTGEIAEEPEFDYDGYDKAVRALTLEQSRYESTRATIEAENAARKQNFEQSAAQAFTDAQRDWQKENAAFMANPLRAKAMQDAINLVDAETKGALPNGELIARASKIAFEAHNWDAAANAGKPTAAQQKQAGALKDRAPPPAPRTVSGAPAAGVEGGGQFGHLESANVLEQEAAYARMTEAERNKWLSEVDGAVA